MKTLIQLQHAHITQHNDNGIRSPWRVLENKTNELLYELPKELTEKNVFNVMKFARDFELIALNTGIQFQKKKDNKLLAKIRELEAHNELLANKLQQSLMR